MFGIGTQELLIIFLIVLLLFGANRIPEIGRALGKGIRDFKRATRDIEDDLKTEDHSPNRIADKPRSETTPKPKDS
jgi:sec-independent protein translocase protein TatA